MKTTGSGLQLSRMHRALNVALLVLWVGACAPARPITPSPLDVRPELSDGQTNSDSGAAAECLHCAPGALDEALLVRSSERVAELKGRGGDCAAYGSVLESSVLGGRVSVRPYMWRVGSRLVSGEARPDGAIVVARDIDPLNVGLRTVDDVVWTLEHEAAHIAFRITNGADAVDDLANARVRSCR